MDKEQILGEWSWCHNGVNRECELIFREGGTGQSGGSPSTHWYFQDNYTLFIGRLNPGDRHIFKIVDENTLEIIEPVRNPPTRCLRVSPVPQRQGLKPIKESSLPSLKLKFQHLQINSLLIRLLTETANSNLTLWKSILPQLLEMLLFVATKAEPIKQRLILEQCQTIMHIASKNNKAFASVGLLQSLMKSPLL